MTAAPTDFRTEEAFVKIIRENSALIYKVCHLYAQNDADKEDLYQEIVIQTWKAYPRFRAESKFTTWLYRIALNTAITSVRKKSRSPKMVFAEEGQFDAPDLPYNPEKEEQLQQLYAAIRQLSELERALVMLYLEDKSYEEMEAIMGISQGNLRVKMTRIKDKLRSITKTNQHLYGAGTP